MATQSQNPSQSFVWFLSKFILLSQQKPTVANTVQPFILSTATKTSQSLVEVTPTVAQGARLRQFTEAQMKTLH